MVKSDLNYYDFADIMNEGLIYVDKSGIIKFYNEKAKEIVGIKRECRYRHESGKIKKGDIVIIADTSLCEDDGGLIPDDFKLIGIDPKNISKSSAVLAVGIYCDNSIGYCKTKSRRYATDEIKLEHIIKDIKVNIKIDFVNRYINIVVNRDEYKCKYNNNFCHTVIIDGITKKVKFYQDKGYTAWKEDIKLILKGENFKAKKIGLNEIDVQNKHILETHKKTEVLQDLLICAEGINKSHKRKFGEINGVSVLYGINGVNRCGERIGAVLLLEDISRLKNIENQRNIAYKKLEKANAELEDKNNYSKLFPKFIGSSSGLMEIKKLAFKASKSNSNVLILGESGTGKSILARAIHDASKNKKKPFIHVNCNSIPENLLESELFGYEKGAFTGACVNGKKGYFEMANGGTIFLDEIGDISMNMQVKLLQVIQNKKFYKIGGNKEIEVDVRIIVATNRNLEREVIKKRFREDLYYRINVFPIKIIPLRERKEDIYELIEYLIPKICERVGCEHKRISGESLSKLTMYSWPGNIRELENVLERAVNLCDEKIILSKHIKIKVERKDIIPKVNYIKPLKETLEEIEKEAIRNVMKYTKGNKKEAMKILEIKKTSLYQKLKNL